ncbi:hypothetical protein L2E82_13796 [Cichorium intybus]|uniref:Uncharacterized protein n=1 Tax=Cichorium intybus TaxID=13427 RepID=A0ACB9EXW1_CICIN|nr:hypothetical protein L2E82_13796 [Cichorium intybus]
MNCILFRQSSSCIKYASFGEKMLASSYAHLLYYSNGYDDSVKMIMVRVVIWIKIRVRLSKIVIGLILFEPLFDSNINVSICKFKVENGNQS